MKALILLGGRGTRLRPFTDSTPKPLLPVVHQPLIAYQLDLLRSQGVKDVVFCTSYKASLFKSLLGYKGMRLSFSHESPPLGTGGAVRKALPLIQDTVLVLNGDLLHAVDAAAFLKSHKRSKADLSIALTRVKDPTQYGLVETDPSGRIRRFLEKPSWDEVTCNTVNAGAYLFEPSVIHRIPPGAPCSLERELFPRLLEEKFLLNGFVIRGYWIDIGTVDKYLQAHLDILAGAAGLHLNGAFRPARPGRAFLLGPGASLGRDVIHEGRGRVALGRGTTVGPFARFRGSVSVGEGCAIGRGAVLEDCAVLGGTRVGEGARLQGCVIGRRCRLGAHAVVGPGRALGDGSSVQRFSQL